MNIDCNLTLDQSLIKSFHHCDVLLLIFVFLSLLTGDWTTL